MSPARRRLSLVLITAAMMAAVAFAMPEAHAQNPPNAGAAKGKPNAGNNKKKPARRKPRGNGAVGVIVPWMMPPSLIIRQTPQAHDEIKALLNMLRYD